MCHSETPVKSSVSAPGNKDQVILMELCDKTINKAISLDLASMWLSVSSPEYELHSCSPEVLSQFSLCSILVDI